MNASGNTPGRWTSGRWGASSASALQRQQQRALTPNLTISPLFAFDDDPVPKPGTSETYVRGRSSWGRRGERRRARTAERGRRRDDDAAAARERSRGETPHEGTRRSVLRVIGTPSWRDIDAIPNLRDGGTCARARARARASPRQFARCDENSRDLLLRMLAFDPERPRAAKRAIPHEYFREEEASVSGAAAERETRRAARGRRALTASGRARWPSRRGVLTSSAEMKDADRPTTFEMEAEDDDAGDERRRLRELSERSRCARRASRSPFGDADCAPASSGGQPRGARAHFREWFERERERRTRPSSRRARGVLRALRRSFVLLFSRLSGRATVPGTRWRRVRVVRGPERPRAPHARVPALLPRRREAPAYARDGRRRDEGRFRIVADAFASVDFEQRYLGGAFGTTGVFAQGGVGESPRATSARSATRGPPWRVRPRTETRVGSRRSARSGTARCQQRTASREEDLPSVHERLEGLRRDRRGGSQPCRQA